MLDTDPRRTFIVCCVLTPFAATACGVCPPTPKLEATSPSGEYVALAYTFECGPVPPFNERVGLKRSSDFDFEEVAGILDVPYSASFKWTGSTKLQITIDCPLATTSECIPPAGRNVTIEMRGEWRDVQLEYVIGPRLSSLGAGDLLERLGVFR